MDAPSVDEAQQESETTLQRPRESAAAAGARLRLAYFFSISAISSSTSSSSFLSSRPIQRMTPFASRTKTVGQEWTFHALVIGPSGRSPASQNDGHDISACFAAAEAFSRS